MIPKSVSDLFASGPAVLQARWSLRSAARLGPRTRVWGTPIIHNNGTLLIGDRVRIVSKIAPVELAVSRQGCLDIRDSVYINCGCSIAAMMSVTIGAHCSIGSHVTIMDNDFHRIDPDRRNEMPPSAPVVLEENVWIGVRAIILRGVTIGAGSVVAHDVPPRSLAAGVPARVIRSLLSPTDLPSERQQRQP